MYEENAKYLGNKTAGEAERVTKMPERIESLAKAVEELTQYAEKLEGRLGHVMQSQPKSPDTTTSSEQLPPLLEEIRNQTDRINYANHCLKSILSRLEI